MYNSITEEKIKQIPQIGEIDIERLPQELTKIYAQIVSLRRQFAEGLNNQSGELIDSVQILQTLANNLETIILTFPNHEKKESIAFVAATAHSLIHKIVLSEHKNSEQIFEIDTISFFISAIVLFLIGNSQADAAEMATHLPIFENSSKTKQRLANYVRALAKGNLHEILNNFPNENDINLNDLQEAALDYLWRELSLGIYYLAEKLTGKRINGDNNDSFDRVISLSVSEDEFFKQKSIFAGPYHLAKLLKILEGDILKRGVINIPTPNGIDAQAWRIFLEKLSSQRPYLWENHKDAVNTDFLNPSISAILTLPTGAGKSTLSELKIASCLISGKKVIYLVPTHALEDQVNKSLATLFEEYKPELIELDAEFTEWEDSNSFPILVMTPERCLTLLNTSEDDFQNVGLIVFDEFHLIHGTDIHKDRRAVDAMYCIISLFTLIPQADYLLISAMVENGNEIREWVQKITQRECLLFNSSWKPTRQLHGCLVFEEDEVLSLRRLANDEKVAGKRKGPSVNLKKSMNIYPHCLFSLKNIWETVQNTDYLRTKILYEKVLLDVNKSWNLTTNRNNIAAKLAIHFSTMGLKTLIFVDNPGTATSTAKKINDSLLRPNCYSDFIESNATILKSLKLELGSNEHSYFNNGSNVGVHHGLLLPVERDLIERYFKNLEGAVVLVATATLAQGINLPAEIVIIAGDDRFDGDSGHRETVEPHELLNAAGRAGRAGQSSQGAVILIPGEIVTVKNLIISEKWWSLKNRVFSKSDQCLKIEDPLQHFLDSIQDDSKLLDITEENILYKFKSKNLSETETTRLLNNSFYAFKAIKEKKEEAFIGQVTALIKRRNELDILSEDIVWIKEISFKTGINPNLIHELGNAINQENFEEFINHSVIELIDWFFHWLQNSNDCLNKIYTKQSTIEQLKKVTGLKDVSEINKNLTLVKNILKQYVQGNSLAQIDKSIPGDTSLHLTKARNFVIRLVPEISFSFGLLSMIIIEKARQQGINKKDLPLTIKVLASCIREGFDEVDKLFYKRNNHLLLRVETHKKYMLFGF
jgi:ATP-dependent RNA helicase DOB1